jgi:MFS transporter, DHA1 family, inner membrane transport protein
MQVAILALTLAAFAVGTSEFVVAGLLPNISSSLHVTIRDVGQLVSVYAFGVVLGAPFLTAATRRLSRKPTLIWLLALFICGNAVCALAPGYSVLMAGRVLAALSHGAFFGISAVVAADMAVSGKKAQAMALVFTGVTLANIVGVPAGTLLGQHAGWRATFWAVSVLALIALIGMVYLVPSTGRQSPAFGLLHELRSLLHPRVLLALSMTVFGFGAVFTVFTYVVPILQTFGHFNPSEVAAGLLVFGLGSTAGMTLGGRLADRWLLGALVGTLAALVLVLIALRSMVSIEVTAFADLFLFGTAGFATAPPLQSWIVQQAGHAPTLASALNIGAFNLGNGLGAWLGGVVLASPLGLAGVPIAGASVALTGIVLTFIAILVVRSNPPRPVETIPAKS